MILASMGVNAYLYCRNPVCRECGLCVVLADPGSCRDGIDATKTKRAHNIDSVDLDCPESFYRHVLDLDLH